jgi:hypothetical protein
MTDDSLTSLNLNLNLNLRLTFLIAQIEKKTDHTNPEPPLGCLTEQRIFYTQKIGKS